MNAAWPVLRARATRKARKEGLQERNANRKAETADHKGPSKLESASLRGFRDCRAEG